MDIKQIQYFDEVVRYKKITTAASKLFISQQGLSMALGRLESELNCRLLNRTKDGLVLTEEGEWLAVHAKQLLMLYNEIESHFENKDDHVTSIRISASFGAVPEYLGDIIKSFSSLNSNIKIFLDEVTDNDCDESIKSGVSELGFSLAPFDKKIFDYKKVFESKFCIIVNKNHPLASKKSINIPQIQDIPVMIMNSRSKSNLIFQQYCSIHGLTMNFSYFAGEVIAIHRLVSRGEGVGITVMSVAESLAHPDVVAIPFEEDELIWSLYSIKRKDHTLSKGAEIFWNYLKDIQDNF